MSSSTASRPDSDNVKHLLITTVWKGGLYLIEVERADPLKVSVN